MADVQSLPVLGLTAVVGAFVLIVIFICSYIKKGTARINSDEAKLEKKSDTNGVPSESAAGKKKDKITLRKKDSRATFTHPWLACCLKAHNGEVLGLDFSPNGKYLASCSEDRTVHLWSVKDFNQKDRRSIRANVEYDHATRVRFSPDSRAFITSILNGEAIRVFKITKKEDGSSSTVQAGIEFPHKHTAEVINIGIASNGRFIMTCYSDTTMKIWDIKGELLATVDTHHMNNLYGSVSPCGRFVASSGFTPDVKVWEVCFDKSGSFQEVKRAFELKGHTAGIYCFSFSSDSRRMATVSKDGTWRLWDTNVEYKKSQDPYLLRTWKYSSSGPSLIALAPDARTVALATGTNISFYSVAADACDQLMEDVFTGPVTALEFSVDSRYLAASGGKHVDVFYNITGYRTTIAELEDKKKAANTAAMKERLQEQINEARELLKGAEARSS